MKRENTSIQIMENSKKQKKLINSYTKNDGGFSIVLRIIEGIIIFTDESIGNFECEFTTEENLHKVANKIMEWKKIPKHVALAPLYPKVKKVNFDNFYLRDLGKCTEYMKANPEIHYNAIAKFSCNHIARNLHVGFSDGKINTLRSNLIKGMRFINYLGDQTELIQYHMAHYLRAGNIMDSWSFWNRNTFKTIELIRQMTSRGNYLPLLPKFIWLKILDLTGAYRLEIGKVFTMPDEYHNSLMKMGLINRFCPNTRWIETGEELNKRVTIEKGPYYVTGGRVFERFHKKELYSSCNNVKFVPMDLQYIQYMVCDDIYVMWSGSRINWKYLPDCLSAKSIVDLAPVKSIDTTVFYDVFLEETVDDDSVNFLDDLTDILEEVIRQENFELDQEAIEGLSELQVVAKFSNKGYRFLVVSSFAYSVESDGDLSDCMGGNDYKTLYHRIFFEDIVVLLSTSDATNVLNSVRTEVKIKNGTVTIYGACPSLTE
jgi:hypothetical protein